MSLTTLLEHTDVRARLNLLLPPRERLPAIEPLVPSGRGNPGRVGTAFDYAFRYETLRRYPNARPRALVAEAAVELMEARRLPEASDCRHALEIALKIVSKHATRKSVTPKQHEELATSAIRLAQLDAYYRSGRPPEDILWLQEDYMEEVADILELLNHVPWEKLPPGERIDLNPVFGDFSHAVGGADADVIWDGHLLDLKTTKHNTLDAGKLHQLVGYYILARAARQAGQDIPEITHVGLYFARHAQLWTMPTRLLHVHPTFEDTATWLITKARDELETG